MGIVMVMRKGEVHKAPIKPLANSTPAEIQQIAQSGQGPNTWAVGDVVPIVVNGTFGGLTYNDTVYAFIIGFNHNPTYEGMNTIHFGLGKTSGGVDIAWVYNYNSTGTGFYMNTTQTNSGGWNNSYMRKTICPAFLNALPTAWQNVIAACTKYSDNTGGGNTTTSDVTSTTDKIWLLSEFEVGGTRNLANSAEQNYQKQYDYYKNGNSKVKYRHDATSTACEWWFRSTHALFSTFFLIEGASGLPGNAFANSSLGFAPAFMVA